jgi:hypothetical protein
MFFGFLVALGGSVMADRTPRRILGVEQKYIFSLIFLLMAVPYVWFLYDSFRQLENILGTIKAPPTTEAQRILQDPNLLRLDSTPLDAVARVALERDTIQLRNHRASTSLATRTWLRFMSVIFGAILVLIGSAFVLGRVSMEQLESEAKLEKWSLALKTTSPGLLLALMGCCLISLPQFARQDISITDAGAYLGMTYQMPAPSPLKGADIGAYEQARDEDIKRALEGIKRK